MPTEFLNIRVGEKGSAGAALGIRGIGTAANKSAIGVQSLTKFIAALAGAGGLALLAKRSIDTAAAFESYDIRLKALLGSQGAANRSIQRFTEIASRTPFAVQDLVAGATTLSTVAQGSEEEVNRLVDQAANIAAVTGLSFEKTAGNLQRALASGIGAADLFRERGVRKIIESITGIPDLTKVPLEELRRAFAETFGEEGGFAGQAEKLSRTLGGALSNIGDAATNFQRKLGEALSPGVIAVATQAIIPLFNDVTGSIDESRDALSLLVVDGFGSLIENIGVVISRGADLVEFLEGLGLRTSTLATTFSVLGTAFSVFISSVATGFKTLEVGVRATILGITKLLNVVGFASDEAVATATAGFDKANAELVDSAVATETELRILTGEIKNLFGELTGGEESNALSQRLRGLASRVTTIAERVRSEGRKLIAERLAREAEDGVSDGLLAGVGDEEAPWIKKFREQIAKGGASALSESLEKVFDLEGSRFAKTFGKVIGESLESSLETVLNRLQTDLAGLFESIGAGGGLAAGLAGAVTALGVSLISELAGGGTKKSSTAAGARAITDNITEQATRGVVVGPTNIAVAQVGDAISDAFIETNTILERILSAIEGGSGLGGSALTTGGAGTEELLVTTTSKSLV